MGKRKTQTPRPEVIKPQVDEKTKLFQELINIAIEISLCEPEDKDELKELIPRLRRTIKKIKRVLASGSS